MNEPRNPIIFIYFRRSIWNVLFYRLRFKKLKKEVGPKWCCINTHWCTNILFRNRVTYSEEGFISEERHSIDKSLFSEVSSSAHLEVQ